MAVVYSVLHLCSIKDRQKERISGSWLIGVLSHSLRCGDWREEKTSSCALYIQCICVWIGSWKMYFDLNVYFPSQL